MSVASTVTQDVSLVGPEQSATTVGRLISLRMSDYLQLCRPRIAVMSAAAAAAGFTLASVAGVDWAQLGISLAGITLLVVSASSLNQVLERHTDGKMHRTSGRPMVLGRLSVSEGWLIGCVSCLVGTLLLFRLVNPATGICGLLTVLIYVGLYTPMKRTSSLCTTVGAIPGAMPPVLGWLAAGGSFGLEALALFALFFVWQFPHFLAIGWIYRRQYEQAGLKMLPSFQDQGRRAGLIALVYAVAFVPVSVLPRFAGLAGSGYVAAALILSFGYLWLTVRFCRERTDVRARQLMVGSLLCLPALLMSLVIDFVRLTS